MGKKKGGAKGAGAADFGPAIPSQAPAAFSIALGPQPAAAGRTPHAAREGFSSSSASATSSYLDALLPDEDLEAHFQEASSSALSEALYDEFSWLVRDFSKVSEEYLYSDIFSIGGFKWRLLLYPRGNNNKYKALSVYLCVPDFQNLDPGWSRLAHFTLSVSNQVDGSKSHSCDGSNKFRKREHDWGFQSLMELSKLHEPGSGFLQNDCIVLQARVQVVTHVFMPMSMPYRRELLQRHFKCSLRFYFEEYLEEKVEEWEEFWLDNGTDFVGFWVGLSPAQRKSLLQISRDTLLRRIRERLFSEKHVDCNLALDALYLAAEKMRETGFSTTAPLQLESPPALPAPPAAASAVAVSGSSPSDAPAPAPAAPSAPAPAAPAPAPAPAPAASGSADPGALSVLVHASGYVYMTETAEFPALLRDVRRDALRLVKDCLSVKKSSDSETDEARLSKLEEIGCRVLHVFAMELVFHECVLSAFREKMARMRQELLILEEEEELRREEERKAAKKEKKKKKSMGKSSAAVPDAAAVEESAPAAAAAARVDPAVATAVFDADDEVLEATPGDACPAKAVVGNVSSKASKRKGKSSSAAAAASASSMPPLQPQNQTQTPSLSAGGGGSCMSVMGGAANDASSDYLSSSSTSSVKHDEAALALKQSTFQVLKESVLSKPKNAAKKDLSKAKVVVNQHTLQLPDTKSDSSVAAIEPHRGRSPPAAAVPSEHVVKHDPLQDPLRLSSCAVFLAQPSYAAVFEKKALCFDISHAKCYRWLVPRRSLILVVDKDAHLLRGVFETTGTVIMNPRKDTPAGLSAYVPISPLLKELFPPISLSRVGHLIKLDALCEESPFESMTSSQFSAILQLLSAPAATPSQAPALPPFYTKELHSSQKQQPVLQQPPSSLHVPRNGVTRSPASQFSHEPHLPGNHSQQTYTSSVASFQHNSVAHPEPQHAASSATPFYQSFPAANGTPLGSSSVRSLPRYQASSAPILAAASAFNAQASSYAPPEHYGRIQAEQQQQQQQQSSFSAGSSGGYSPWGGFDQRIFGSNESQEHLLGGLRHEFEQATAENPQMNEDVPAMPYFWSGASNSAGAQYHQPGSRFFGKVDAEQRQSHGYSLSSSMQSLDLQDHGGIGQSNWTPIEHNLSSGFGVGNFGSNTFTRSSQQQWQNLSSELLDQRGKVVQKH